MIYGKLATTGLLTDIQYVAVPRTWTDGSTDVPLVAMPTFRGPCNYDAVNQVAIPADPIALQRTAAIAMLGDPILGKILIALAMGVTPGKTKAQIVVDATKTINSGAAD